MPLSPRTRLGPYEIIKVIGVGGMGEVYRARDPRLDRIVAIKVLPRLASLDPMARVRAEQEARIVAGLTHPHICALFDVGREGDIDYLVMEFLEGETLADRMTRGLMPLDLVMEYGTQIAAALAAAHRHGAVHCDLKPANVMLTREGVKLLDFGIAQLRAVPAVTRTLAGVADLPTGETRSVPRTVAGTLHYMAPEQLRGTAVDARTDIFALGAVLYQMVSGRRPFDGDTEASVIAAVLDADPPPLESHPSRPVPMQLDHLIHACLAKDPDDRWQSARDVQRELSFLAAVGGAAAYLRRPESLRERWGWRLIVAAAIAASLATAWALRANWSGTTASPLPRVRFDVRPVVPATLPINQIELSVSPGGRHVAFIARHRGTTSLWVRAVDAAEAREIEGTEGASQPFWSPDSGSIGFHAQGALKRVSLQGGVVQHICTLGTMKGATWSPGGMIVFSQLNTLAQVPDYGGTPVLLPPVPGQQSGAVPVWPQFLPDGRRYLFRLVRGPSAGRGIYVGSLHDNTFTRVLETTRNVIPTSRYLLYVQSDNLMAQPFDFDHLRVNGEPTAILDQVMENLGELSGPSISVSQNGVLAYRGRHAFPTTLSWFDRAGLSLETLSTPPGCRNPEISPLGGHVVMECPNLPDNTRDLWIVDTASGRPSRLTTDRADDSDPVWSPDGRWIVFSSEREKRRDFYRRSASGAGRDERLFTTPRTKYPNDWSHDGRFILYTSREENTGWDIWMLPVQGGEPEPLVNSSAAEIEPQLSPDGRWLAYTSDESGRMEVYVRGFRGPGGPWLISTGGGSDPRWRDDGTELYYLSPDRALMAVGVSRGPRFGASAPAGLFKTRTSGPLGVGVRFNYAVGRSGRRFLITSDVPDAVPSAIKVFLNWDVE